MSTLAIKNVGTIISGDLKQPILKANTVIVKDGIIEEMGDESLILTQIMVEPGPYSF